MNINNYLRIKVAGMYKLAESDKKDEHYSNKSLIRGALNNWFTPEDISEAIPYMKGSLETVYGVDREPYDWEKEWANPSDIYMPKNKTYLKELKTWN